MDLSALLSPQGNGNLLGVLLPLLLGGKATDIASLLSGKGGAASPLTALLASSQNSHSSDEDYPPLFGESRSKDPATISAGDLMNLLGGSSKKERTSPDISAEKVYPYELQYNRPYRKSEG